MIDKYKFLYRTFLVLFWAGMCIGFICDEVKPLAALRNPLFLILDAVLLILGLGVLKNKGDKLVIGSFFLIGFVSTILLNHLGIVPFFNGSRDFFGLLFVLPIFRYFLTGPEGKKFKKKFDGQLRIWLIIQAVCLVYQFLKYGANDHGGGSMGNGSSGMVSMLIYIISYYLTIQNWDFKDYAASFRANKWNFALLFPTFLNETKVSFILLLTYAILLYRPTRATALKLVYAIPLGIATLIGLVTIYLNVTEQDADEIFSTEYIYEYLVGEDIDYYIDIALLVQDGFYDDAMATEDAVWGVDIQRVSKIILLPDALKREPGGLVLGAGLGQLKGFSMADSTKFAREYKWLLRGSRPWIFFVLVQIGIIGLIWFYWMLVRMLFFGFKYTSAIKRMLILLGLSLLIIQFYNDSLRFYFFCLALFYPLFALRFHNTGEDNKEKEKLPATPEAIQEPAPQI